MRAFRRREIQNKLFSTKTSVPFFFFKQKTAYEIMPSLVGSEMCIRDRYCCRRGIHRQEPWGRHGPLPGDAREVCVYGYLGWFAEGSRKVLGRFLKSSWKYFGTILESSCEVVVRFL